jgi:hypothetical protein
VRLDVDFGSPVDQAVPPGEAGWGIEHLGCTSDESPTLQMNDPASALGLRLATLSDSALFAKVLLLRPMRLAGLILSAVRNSKRARAKAAAGTGRKRRSVSVISTKRKPKVSLQDELAKLGIDASAEVIAALSTSSQRKKRKGSKNATETDSTGSGSGAGTSTV